jgi:hypothetical protein
LWHKANFVWFFQNPAIILQVLYCLLACFIFLFNLIISSGFYFFMCAASTLPNFRDLASARPERELTHDLDKMFSQKVPRIDPPHSSHFPKSTVGTSWKRVSRSRFSNAANRDVGFQGV